MATKRNFDSVAAMKEQEDALEQEGLLPPVGRKASLSSGVAASAQADRMRAALENSNSLFAAMLHETRPRAEIEAQIHENRTALNGPMHILSTE